MELWHRGFVLRRVARRSWEDASCSLAHGPRPPDEAINTLFDMVDVAFGYDDDGV